MSDQESLLKQFFEKTEVFTQYYTRLQAQLPKLVGTPYEKEVKDLLADGEKLRSRIDGIKQGIDSVVDFAQTSWGSITDWAKSVVGLNGMGAFPLLIPAATLAGISTAIYLLNAWIERAHNAQIKIDQFNSLIKQGHDPQQAATITNELLAQKAQSSIFSKIIIAGLVVGGSYLLLKNKKLLIGS